MGEVFKLCQTISLVPRRWYGSSALANLALRTWKINNYSRRTTIENCPKLFYNAITRAYFGGRIEAFKLGTFHRVYVYDINSAYPYAITLLPKTKGKHWVKVKRFIKGFGVWHIKWKHLSASPGIGYFPLRLRDGSIKFPLQGEGWYWEPEVSFALKSSDIEIKIIEGYFLIDENEKTPLAKKISELYDARLKYKKKNDLRHWIIKILLNSMYGKFAQKVGRADFKNFCYAGYITSKTRAMLLEASKGKENDIIAYATDGIYSTSNLAIKSSQKLGKWSVKKLDKLTVIMSGLYLTEENGKQTTKQRGYHRELDWRRIFLELNRRNKVSIDIYIFVGFLLSFNFRREYGKDYLKFVKRTKTISPSTVSKRRYLINQIKDWRKDSCESLPIKRLDGISWPIKTEPEKLTDEDLWELLEDL